jgi:hypothetical protein
MDKDVAGLRKALAAVEKGRGKRYPAALRARVVAWAVERRRGGASWEAIKRELGQEYDTVRRWCRAAVPTTRALVPVRVIAHPVPARVVAVVSPSGFRIDGLSLTEAAALLREIG